MSTAPLREQGRELLLRFAADRTLDATDRAAAACHAAVVPGPIREQALRSLDDLLAEPRLPPRIVLDVVAASSRYGNRHGHAVAHLERNANDDAVHPYLRCRAIHLLATHHVPARDDAIDRLCRLLSDSSASVDHRRWAAESLAAINERLRSPAHRALQDIDANQPLDRRTRQRLRRSIQTISRGT